MVTAGIFPFKENSHGRAGNRTRDLMISSQRLWPLDHEADPFIIFYTEPKNSQLFHVLSHSSYMFRHYRVILTELVLSTFAKLQKYVECSSW